VNTCIRPAALAALTNGFLTGVSIPVDGGEHLVWAKGSDMQAIQYRHADPIEPLT
jgi:hypothetical protein